MRMKMTILKIVNWKNVLKTLGVLIVLAGIVGFGEYRNRQLSTQIEGQLTANTSEIQMKIDALNSTLAEIQSQSSNLGNTVQSIQSNNNVYSAQAGQISAAATTLYKLSKTDPQLLQKYSKVYFLNENYKPANLTNLDPNYLFNKNSALQINTQISSFLTRLLVAEKSAELNLKVISAYRSFGTQALLKSSYKVTYGAGTANSFSADQGYSEHQLGTALDFTTPSVGDTFNSFDKTPEYTWLQNNAYKYGFVLSYPADNKYYEFEPWHWRFVGVDLATRLHNEGKYFYELDQSTINDYLAVTFD